MKINFLFILDELTHILSKLLVQRFLGKDNDVLHYVDVINEILLEEIIIKIYVVFAQCFNCAQT